ncbi:MAG: ribonuclease HI [Holosporales bacterium]|jgi:ribonuclease HI|nr:ribonuclease HI [Holosporales bacterium]
MLLFSGEKMSNKTKFNIFTDGACSGNPGPGGWAAVICSETKQRDISGAEPNTTNNRMELKAAIEALKTLDPGAEAQIFTDSTYLQKGITVWLHAWKARNWTTSAKTPVKNKDLWLELEALCATHRVTWSWIKGHVGHPENERADQIARTAIIGLAMNTPL